MKDAQAAFGDLISKLILAANESDAAAAERAILAAFTQGTDPNKPVSIFGEMHVPLELLVDPQGRSTQQNRTRALALFLKHDALEVNGPRAALGDLTPVQFAALNAFELPGDDSMEALRLLATDVRTDLAAVIGMNTEMPEAHGKTLLATLKMPEWNFPEHVAQVIEEAGTARQNLKGSESEARPQRPLPPRLSSGDPGEDPSIP